MRRTILSIFVAAFFVEMLFTGVCMSQPKYGGTLVVGMESDINKLDPHKVVTGIEGRVTTLYCDNSLVASSKNNEVSPGLATSWNVSQGGKEYTFHLRKGVKFHNGREVTAEDIKFNMDRILDPKTASALRIRFLNIDSINVIDPYTVKFNLKKPSGSFLEVFSGTTTQVSIIARECVKEDGTVTHPIGTGPFEFVEWKTNDYIKVKKFKDYWGKGLPFVDEVILKPVPDATVRLTGLQAGDLDVVYPLPIEHVANLMKTPQKSYYFLTDSTAGVAFIHFNMSKPPFNDARVRQAVAYGINKQEMMMGIYQGHGEVVNQFVPKASRWHCDVPDMAQNKQKAKALLKEAGYPDGLEVTLTTSNTFPYMYKTAQIAQEQLKEIGMKINLDLSDWPATVKKMVSGDFAFGVAGWAPIVSDLDILYPTIFTPQGGYTFLMGKAYNNPKLVELIENAGTTLDLKKRKELYTRALETIIQDAPLVLICFGPGPFGARSYVKGFEAHANGFFVYGGGGFQYTWLDK